MKTLLKLNNLTIHNKFFVSFIINIILLLIIVLVVINARNLNYQWDWSSAFSYVISRSNGKFILGSLLYGGILTIKLVISSCILVLVFSYILYIISKLPGNLFSLSIKIYMTIIRNIPFIVLLYFFYLVISNYLGNLSDITVGIATLVIYHTSYMIGINRESVQSVNKNNYIVGHALGLNSWQIFIFIIFPQAIRVAIPMYRNEVIIILHNTALLSLIGITALVGQARNIIAQTFMVFEIWIIVAILYILFTILFLILMELVSSRLKRRT